ncbi:hypothetical protein OQA88_8598 [Cercophora sp. LCS_1]
MLLLLFIPLTSALPQAPPEPDCLTKSLALKKVTLANAEIIRGSPFNKENTTVSFTVSNPLTGATTRCNASDVALTPNGIGSDPYKWYACLTEPEGPEGSGHKSRFQYDATLNFLTVEESWGCDDTAALVTAELWSELPMDWCTTEGGFGRGCKQGGMPVDFPVKVTVKRQ